MIAPKQVYTSDEVLPDLRMLVSLRPEALYADSRELARLLCCPEAEVEEARRWMLEDSLEVRA